jgi:pimeloyl-ACP methyl ester carboxylesterase
MLGDCHKNLSGDHMRNCGFYLMLLAILVLPGTASPQENNAPDGKKARKGNATKSVPAHATELEHWSALNDIKTGLHPQPPVELQKDEEPEFVREVVRVEWRSADPDPARWRPADPIDLWIMHPKTPGKVPVILYLYGYPNDSDVFRDNGWAKRATADGFAAVGFVSALTGQRYRTRPMKQWFISQLDESIGSTVHDVQLILNYLADRGDMDMGHVGMFGTGSGASIAILAAQADSRIKTLDLLDPWGDWPDWLRESPVVPEDERSRYTTPEFLKSVATLDPVAYLPLLKTRGFRLQQTLSEPITPNSAKERIAASVPSQTVLEKYANAGELMISWQNNGLSSWIKQELRAQMQADERNHGLTAQDSDSPRK